MCECINYMCEYTIICQYLTCSVYDKKAYSGDDELSSWWLTYIKQIHRVVCTKQRKTFWDMLFFKIAVTLSQFCGTTGILCFLTSVDFAHDF